MKNVISKFLLICISSFLFFNIGMNFSAYEDVATSIQKLTDETIVNETEFVEDDLVSIDQTNIAGESTNNIHSSSESYKDEQSIGGSVNEKNQLIQNIEENSSHLFTENDSVEVNGKRQFAFTLNYNPTPENSGNTTIKLFNPTNTSALHAIIPRIGYVVEYLGENGVNDYYNIRLQGGIFAIHKSEILGFATYDNIKSFPYYENVGGHLVHHIEKNITSTNQFYQFTLGLAPMWMSSNKKYYSFDGIYFTDSPEKLGQYDQQINAVNRNMPYYDYYLYQPMRTKTSYTAAELNQAFYTLFKNTGINKTSKMINTGQYFIDAQEKYGINALFFMSIAINESAYGTSGYAIDGNNLFGYGAVDSYPDGAHKFPTIQNGIMTVANEVSWGYGDADYQSGYLYYGSNLGNKNSGMNVRYASDPYWGEKAAKNYQTLDSLLGGKDYQKYGLALVNQGASVYWNSDGTNYAHTYKYSTSTANPMYPVVIQNNNIWTQINMEPPYNQDYYVGGKNPQGGAYYWYAGYVHQNELFKVNDARQNNNNKIRDGNFLFYLHDNQTINFAEQVDENNKVIKKYSFYPNTKYDNNKWLNIQYEYSLDLNGYLTGATLRKQGTTKNIKIYSFYPNTKYNGNRWLNAQYEYSLDTNGYLTGAFLRKQGTLKNIKIYSFYPNTKYDGNRWLNAQYEYSLDTNSYLTGAFLRKQGTLKNIKIYSFYPNTKYDGDRWLNAQYEYSLDTNGYLTGAFLRKQGTLKNIKIYSFYPSAKYDGNRWKRVEIQYDLDEYGYIDCAFRKVDITGQITHRYIFEEYTKYDSNRWAHVLTTITH